MATPNFRPWVADGDIEAQLQDQFTHGAPPACTPERQRMDFMDIQCAGKLRCGFDKAISHLRCRQKLRRFC
jgi:hypothetical protein